MRPAPLPLPPLLCLSRSQSAGHCPIFPGSARAGGRPARAHCAPCPAAEPISARQPALRPHVHKQPEKTTRVRTVLNEKQLHTLRTCYAANPRPDALMKEQLVEMTGLSPRVIRVWFQNKRCKDKKRSIMMKQLQQQQPNDKTVSGPGPGRGLEEACVLSAQMGWLSPSGSRAGAGPGGPSLPPAPRGEATGPGLPARAPDAPGGPSCWLEAHPPPAHMGGLSRPSISPPCPIPDLEGQSPPP